MIPVWCLRHGYRSVPLRAPNGGNAITDCALFVFFAEKATEFDPAELAAADSAIDAAFRPRESLKLPETSSRCETDESARTSGPSRPASSKHSSGRRGT